ncbi:MAG: alkane 1-monooxygenase [Proteobacteria bacterium]|nr:MAG: alkane 1-monooxygenase [Pseudomonadota bacterium]
MSSLGFSLPILYLLGSSLCFLSGGLWMSLPGLFLLIGSVIFDATLPFDKSSHDKGSRRILNILLYSTLPGVYLAIVCFNIEMARSAGSHSLIETIGAYFSIGLLIASTGTTVAHELVHRVGNPWAVRAGRWLLAPTLDTSFAIEHVYGHHANVATRADPASARYGETVYIFFLRSTFGGIRSAWHIETQRLAKRGGKSAWSFSNRVLSGQLMSLCVLALFVAIQGPFGAFSFLAVAVVGKFYLEAINYVEHYGLVREVGKPVEPRHSWNCMHRFSTRFLFNLTRHSHHHAKGYLPYWKLQSQESVPNFPHGYMLMLVLSMVPPVFKRCMAPHVEHWVNHLATEAERTLVLQRAV